MADWGRGFKRGTDKPECTKHGTAFLAREANEEDVIEVFCLACCEHELTVRGRRQLAEKRKALLMCACSNKAPHSWEPGESCPPERVQQQQARRD